MKTKYLLLAIVVVICIISCEKPEGVGGTSTIKGTVVMQQFNDLNQIEKTFGAPDERVYIIYGENEIYNDEERTHYDGKYEFTSLRKGNYTLFSYSECIADSCLAPSVPVQIQVEITENGQIINADEIVVNNF